MPFEKSIRTYINKEAKYPFHHHHHDIHHYSIMKGRVQKSLFIDSYIYENSFGPEHTHVKASDINNKKNHCNMPDLYSMTV